MSKIKLVVNNDKPKEPKNPRWLKDKVHQMGIGQLIYLDKHNIRILGVQWS